MNAVINNGKVHTYNIYGMILLLLFILPCFLSGSVTTPKKDGKWIIVIDPGHGGRDPGAVGLISKEKNITLAIAKKIAKYFRENLKDVTVIMTRDDDSFVDLYERPKIANRNNADLFISIHANAMPGSKTTMGAETWIMGIASSEENLQVAMKENEVILLEDDYSTKYQGFDPKSPESYIIFTLTQNVFQKQSTELASKIQTQFREKVNRKDRGVKQAGFVVLYNTTMPSVLIETGFISTPAEEKYLNSAQGQDYIASAIYRACRDYFADVDLRSWIKIDTTAAAVAPPSASSAPYPALQTGKIIFTVQVATASVRTETKPENFKGLKDIVEISVDNRYKYATGSFDDYSDAVRYRKKLEAIYPDAFVIAIKDNKILPLQQALEQKKKK